MVIQWQMVEGFLLQSLINLSMLKNIYSFHILKKKKYKYKHHEVTFLYFFHPIKVQIIKYNTSNKASVQFTYFWIQITRLFQPHNTIS